MCTYPTNIRPIVIDGTDGKPEIEGYSGIKPSGGQQRGEVYPGDGASS